VERGASGLNSAQRRKDGLLVLAICTRAVQTNITGTLYSTTALMAELFVNAAILVLAASFNQAGYTEVDEIQDAYRLLTPALGTGIASVLLAWRCWHRADVVAHGDSCRADRDGRVHAPTDVACATAHGDAALAIVPGIAITALYGEGGTTQLLLCSQVALSLQLSAAVHSAGDVHRRPNSNGCFVNPRWARAFGLVVAGTIAAMNGWLVWQSVT